MTPFDMVAASLVPPMPPLAPDDAGGLRVLYGLRTNGFSAFPPHCMDEPVVRLRILHRHLVIVTGPYAIRHVLQTRAEDYERLPAGRGVLAPIVGRGLLVSEGETWRRQRRAMAPAFTPHNVPVLARHVMRCAEAACLELEAACEGPLDLLATMQRVSLEIAASSMFSLESESFGVALRAMVSGYMATIGRPSPGDFLLPRGVPTLLGLRRALFRRRWRRLIGGVVARRRAWGDNAAGADAPRDLFDMMRAAHGDGAEDLLQDEVATMIVAGHETTALLLFWACLLLAQAPEWQARVAKEASRADLSPGCCAAALPTLSHTRAVIQEALRLYPPAFITARLARRSHDVCGVQIPNGAMVLIPFWLLHRNPRWWTAPAAFDPGRFLERPEPERFTFLPFGAGPHVCIGAQLAQTEAVLVLARLLRRSEIRLLEDRPVLPVGVLSTRPNYSPAFQLTRRRGPIAHGSST